MIEWWFAKHCDGPTKVVSGCVGVEKLTSLGRVLGFWW